MKKIYQDKDNCMAACLATLLNIDLKDVIDYSFEHRQGKNWLVELNRWCLQYHKVNLIRLDNASIQNIIDDGYNGYIILVIGDSIESKRNHAIITDSKLRVIHNPNKNIQMKDIYKVYGINTKVLYGFILAKVK